MDDPEWRRHFEGRIDAMSLRTSKLEGLSEANKVHRDNVERRLSNIEGGQTWIIRLILGAIALAAITFVISGGLAP